MVCLTDQEKREIVFELRGIAQEIDIEFEQMVLYDLVSSEKLQQMEIHLNKILGLLVMYMNVINSMET